MSWFPLILSSPSGAGKTTIAKELLRRRIDLGYSVSCTTRPSRRDEIEGRDYFFLDRTEFEAAQKRGDFAESAEVHGHLYGTLRSEVDRVLESGRHVVMDIDVQGARQFLTAYPDSVLVFILPPDAEVMLTRLKARGSESADTLSRRLRSAVEELRAVDSYEYIVVNADLDHAVKAVSGIVDAESTRLSRLSDVHSRVEGLIADLETELRTMKRSDT